MEGTLLLESYDLLPILKLGGRNYQWQLTMAAGYSEETVEKEWRVCPLHQEVDKVWRAASAEPWAGQKSVGKNQRQKKQRDPRGVYCWWSGQYAQRLFAPATGCITLTGSCPLWYLIEKDSTTSCRQSKGLRKSMKDNFLRKGIDSSPTTGNAVLDLMGM